jgi:hypothetical protein
VEIDHLAPTPRVRVLNGGGTAVPETGALPLVLDPDFGSGAFYARVVPKPPQVYVLQAVFPSEGEMRERVAEADSSARLACGEQFAKIAYEIPGVQEIRASVAGRELFVTALTADRDMERDLHLQALFAEVVATHAGDAFLRVRVFDATQATEYGTLLR